ncbi:DUF2865 domain-containing protein [Sesbania bispinosa]|nr:DUF2865 domain-containing protein [Sesbania bispinosa]
MVALHGGGVVSIATEGRNGAMRNEQRRWVFSALWTGSCVKRGMNDARRTGEGNYMSGGLGGDSLLLRRNCSDGFLW